MTDIPTKMRAVVLMGHGGMDDEDVALLIQEMNEAIAEKESVITSDSLIIKLKQYSRLHLSHLLHTI